MLGKNDYKYLNEFSKDQIVYVDNDKNFKLDGVWFLLMIREHSEIIFDYIEFGINWLISWVFPLCVGTIRLVMGFYIMFAIYASVGGNLNNIGMGDISTLAGFSMLIRLSIVLMIFMILLYMVLYLTSIGEETNLKLKKIFNKISFRTIPFFVPSVITIWEYEGNNSKPHLYQIDKNSVNKYIKENYDDVINLGISGKELTKYLLLKNQTEILMLKNQTEILMYSDRPVTNKILHDKYRLNFLDRQLDNLNLLEVYRKFEDVEINDVMYLEKEKVVRKMRNEKIVRKVIKKSIY